MRFALGNGLVGDFEVAEGNKINNLGTRHRPRNVVDFLVKDCGMSAPEAITKLDEIYREQGRRGRTLKKDDEPGF